MRDGIKKHVSINTGAYSWDYPGFEKSNFDHHILYPQLEALMWKYAAHTLTDIGNLSGVSELELGGNDFFRVDSAQSLKQVFPYASLDSYSRHIDGIEFWVNDEFTMLGEREALFSSIFIMDNKVSVHTRNTYKYLDWDEVLFSDGIDCSRFCDQFFCLLTDTNAGIPVIGLYKEAIAGFYINKAETCTPKCVLIDKHTAVCIYHFLYGLSTRILPTLPYMFDEFDHRNQSIDSQRSLDLCNHVFNILNSVDSIIKLKEFILKESWE